MGWLQFQIFPSFSWVIFGHVTYLGQSHPKIFDGLKEMIDNHLIFNKREWNNCFVKNDPNPNRKLKLNKTENAPYQITSALTFKLGEHGIMAYPGLRPLWITPSEISRILHILITRNSIIALSFIQNISPFLMSFAISHFFFKGPFLESPVNLTGQKSYFEGSLQEKQGVF